MASWIHILLPGKFLHRECSIPPVRTAKIGSFCMPNRVQTTQKVCVEQSLLPCWPVWPAGFRFSPFTGPSWCLSIFGTCKQSLSSQGSVQWICHTVADKCKWKKPVLSGDLFACGCMTGFEVKTLAVSKAKAFLQILHFVSSLLDLRLVHPSPWSHLSQKLGCNFRFSSVLDAQAAA